MSIKIFYCKHWNYEPRAAGLAVAIKRALGHDCVIEPGKIGQFDVVVDGKTIFSKQSEGRFPETDEILKLIG